MYEEEIKQQKRTIVEWYMQIRWKLICHQLWR